MIGTSVRKDLSALSRAERIDVLRSRMAVVGKQAAMSPTGASVDPQENALEVGLPLTLPRRAVTNMADCPALVVECVHHVTAAGGHVGIVGWPQLSLAEVEHLNRIVAVPDPGPDPLCVSGVLVEGLDLVIHYSPVELNLSPTRARPLLARLRKGAAALVFVGVRAPSPGAVVEANVSAYHGIGRGYGRITGVDVSVSMTVKADRVRTTLTLGKKPHMEAV